MLREGQFVPRFSVTTIDGAAIDYGSIWQRRHLLLVVVRRDTADAAVYISELEDRMTELTANDTACVVTTDTVEGVSAPAVVVADRWGEIFFAAACGRESELPRPDELIEWLRYVQVQCPECQGETR